MNYQSVFDYKLISSCQARGHEHMIGYISIKILCPYFMLLYWKVADPGYPGCGAILKTIAWRQFNSKNCMKSKKKTHGGGCMSLTPLFGSANENNNILKTNVDNWNFPDLRKNICVDSFIKNYSLLSSKYKVKNGTFLQISFHFKIIAMAFIIKQYLLWGIVIV